MKAKKNIVITGSMWDITKTDKSIFCYMFLRVTLLLLKRTSWHKTRIKKTKKTTAHNWTCLSTLICRNVCIYLFKILRIGIEFLTLPDHPVFLGDFVFLKFNLYTYCFVDCCGCIFSTSNVWLWLSYLSSLS